MSFTFRNNSSLSIPQLARLLRFCNRLLSLWPGLAHLQPGPSSNPDTRQRSSLLVVQPGSDPALHLTHQDFINLVALQREADAVRHLLQHSGHLALIQTHYQPGGTKGFTHTPPGLTVATWQLARLRWERLSLLEERKLQLLWSCSRQNLKTLYILTKEVAKAAQTHYIQ